MYFSPGLFTWKLFQFISKDVKLDTLSLLEVKEQSTVLMFIPIILSHTDTSVEEDIKYNISPAFGVVFLNSLKSFALS